MYIHINLRFNNNNTTHDMSLTFVMPLNLKLWNFFRHTFSNIPFSVYHWLTWHPIFLEVQYYCKCLLHFSSKFTLHLSSIFINLTKFGLNSETIWHRQKSFGMSRSRKQSPPRYLDPSILHFNRQESYCCMSSIYCFRLQPYNRLILEILLTEMLLIYSVFYMW